MKYRVSFSGWAYVEADSAEEAEEKVLYENGSIFEETKCIAVDEVDDFPVCLED